jgi:PKD repeat protein
MKNFYKSFGLAFMLTALAFMNTSAQNAWINEIHYDNTGTDAGEFIEVVIQNAGSYNLASFTVTLYNGNGGASYDTKTVDLFTPGAVSNGYSIFYYTYPANGIQNGAPDGMAIDYQGTLISGQFLSYEGVFTATGGPANGVGSSDIGVLEPGTDPVGLSLQLTGTGTGYSSFAWLAPDAQTPGQLNNGQTFGGTIYPEPTNYPTNFATTITGLVADLTWTDATGAQLPGHYLVLASDQDNITPPADGTVVSDDANLSDGTGALNVPYGTQACSFYKLNGETTYYFKIFPYTNTGSNANYKTDGTPPSAQGTTLFEINVTDFEDVTFGTWDTISVASDKNWAVVNFTGAYFTSYFAQMNGFNQNVPSNDWLISPSINMNNFNDESLEFHTIWKFGDTDNELTLKFSTNYNGGDPTLATWTDITFTKPAVADTWTSSGNLDLSGISGSNVHLAFQYQGSANPRRWGVDEIEIVGDLIGAYITVNSPAGGENWEQGTAHDITWTANNTLANVKIELTTNASAGSPDWTVLNPSIPAGTGTWTWNIPPTQATSDDCQIRITDFASDAEGLSGIFSIIEPIYVPQLVITELMYNPPESGNDTLEFIELLNDDNVPVDLEGFYFSSGIEYVFPAITLEPGAFYLISVDSLIFEAAYGLPSYQYEGALNNSGELVELRNNYDMVVDSVRYDDADPWPVDPDGNGPSLAFCDPSLDNGVAENWNVSIELAFINSEGDSLFASPGTGCSSWPVADFVADVTVVTTGGSVNFTDLSTGDPLEWIWTFPGGTPGAYVGQTPPAITYNTPGTYNVALYISNAAGTSTEEKIDYINVGDAPDAEFSGNPTNLFAGETVDFTDQSTNSPASWLWEFEGAEPSSSTLQHPSTIRYPVEGTYDVTLTVTNIFGEDELLKENYIDVMPVGLDENGGGLIYLYPNPNNGNFNLANPGSLRLEIRVFNMVGELVEGMTTTQETIRFEMESLGRGVYFLQIRDVNDGQMATRKVVIR